MSRRGGRNYKHQDEPDDRELQRGHEKKQRWWTKLSDQEILRLLRKQVYTVDIHTGVVYRGGTRALALKMGGRSKDRPYVRLHHGNKRRIILVSRLVWMAATGAAIPLGFEIHHRDKNYRHNPFSNLLCLHRLDHQKIHNGGDVCPYCAA